MSNFLCDQQFIDNLYIGIQVGTMWKMYNIDYKTPWTD